MEGGGFILRTNGEDASDAELGGRHCLPAQGLGAHQGVRLLRLPPQEFAAPGFELAAARAARSWWARVTQTIRVDSREQFEALQAFGKPSSCRHGGAEAAALQGRAADF